MKTEHESTIQKHTRKCPTHILLKTNVQWAKDEEHHLKTENEDEIDEFHQSQLKFEYNVYLLHYTIEIKKI